MKIISGGTVALVGDYETKIYSSPSDFSLLSNSAAYGAASGLTNDQVLTLINEANARRTKLVSDITASVVAALSNLAPGSFTATDRAMLDDIATKAELANALTSTVNSVNSQAALNRDSVIAQCHN